jgi:hypothetical protein
MCVKSDYMCAPRIGNYYYENEVYSKMVKI